MYSSCPSGSDLQVCHTFCGLCGIAANDPCLPSAICHKHFMLKSFLFSSIRGGHYEHDCLHVQEWGHLALTVRYLCTVGTKV